MIPLLVAAIFCAFAAAFTIAALLWMKQQRSKQILKALRPEYAVEQSDSPDLLLAGSDRESKRWNSWAPLAVVWNSLQRDLRQADLEWPVETLLLYSVVGAVCGFSPTLFLDAPASWIFLIAGVFGASAPLLYVRHRRKARIARIEEQFPDALDFLSRAMLAGHAFSVSLEMLADEMPEPVGGEFRKLYHEQNLGSPIDAALQALSERCGLLDVQFFVSAVLLHRETGGNLTEILGRLSFTIRERFRLKGQVRAASAHGRVTGLVLTAMPVFLMIGLMITSPDYLSGLMKDPHGRYMVAGAVAGQFIGYLCIRSITDIQV